MLVGPNAVGKTNVIEGIQLMTSLASFRNATTEQLIRHGAPRARIEATLSDDRRLLDLEMLVEERSKRYKLNGKAKRPVDLRGLAPSVTFTPDDLDLVKGSMSVRRRALDVLGSQVNSNYHVILKDYERVLRHKNKLLKEESPQALLDSIDELLVTCGAQLTCYRLSLFEKLAPWIEDNYGRICCAKEALKCSYELSCASLDAASGGPLGRDEARAMLREQLARHRQDELRRHRALIGPHADRVSFCIDGMDAAQYGSQGQQRSIVLAFKIAEADVIEELLDQKPLLLLDDVMSELDVVRREALVNYVSESAQAFITTANLAYFDSSMLNRADVVEL